MHAQDLSVAAYCRRMQSGSAWGGGIEMAAAAHLTGVNVFVYEVDQPTVNIISANAKIGPPRLMVYSTSP